MKKIVAWILALMMLLSCCAALAEETKPLAGKKLTIALSPNFMFFETVSETDPTGYEGLDIDIIKELSDMLGFEFEIVPMSFSSLVGSLQANSVDMVISGMTSTEERQQRCVEETDPRRADFSPEQGVAIKAFLGPWPRALETAGIKPPRDDGFAEKRLEKRIRQKRRRTALKIQAREKRDSLEHPGL